MSKIKIPIIILTITIDILIGTAILFSGPVSFLSEWWLSNSIYIVAILAGGIGWYLLWLKRIKYKIEFAGLTEVDNNEIVDMQVDKNLFPMMCPKCEHDAYCLTTKTTDEAMILVCNQCNYVFAYVWCEKCGMGGHFLKDISQKPNHWECPDCKGTYSIPMDIYEHPITLLEEDELPRDTNLRQKVRQRLFEIEQAGYSVGMISTLLLSFTLVFPAFHAVNRMLIMMGMSPLEGNGSSLPLSLLAGLVTLLIFIGIWYGMMLLLFLELKRQKARQDQTW